MLTWHFLCTCSSLLNFYILFKFHFLLLNPQSCGGADEDEDDDGGDEEGPGSSFQVNVIAFVFLTVKVLSIGTNRSMQTVQTQIRPLLRISVYTFCYSFCIFWIHYWMAELPCANFRLITETLSGVPVFGIFTAFHFSWNVHFFFYFLYFFKASLFPHQLCAFWFGVDFYSFFTSIESWIINFLKLYYFTLMFCWRIYHILIQGWSAITLGACIWAASWQNQQSECAPNEDSDQPGH